MVMNDDGLLLAARVLLQLLAWPLAALLAWRAVRGNVSSAAWAVIVLLLSSALAEAIAVAAPDGSRVLYSLVNIAVVALFVIYPDGRPVPRWILVPAGIEIAIQIANVASGLRLEELQPWWPLHFLPTYLLLLWFGQIYRYRRRSSVAEREAVRWGVLGFVLMIGSFTIWSLLYLASDGAGGLEGAWLAVLLNILPSLGLALGLLAPRALPVDRVLRVALILTIAILGVAGVALGAVAALTAADVKPAAAAWIAAMVTAGLTIPIALLARWVADRIVGRTVDPLRALTELGKRLTGTVEPRTVPREVVHTIASSLGLQGARLSDGAVLHASVGVAGVGEEAFPIVYQNERVATLFALPRAGESRLSERDREVIAQIAAQAAPALHGARVVSELIDARARVVLAREEERKRLRRELHDDLAPTFAGLGLSAAAIEELSRIGDTKATEAAGRLVAGLRDATRQVREIAYDLRPPVLDDRGLVAAIEERVAVGGDLPEVRLDSTGLIGALPAAVEAAAFRIVQEAVLNVRRHAAASVCEVRLVADGKSLRVAITDDGVGWTEGRDGVGVRGMRERATELGGTLEIEAVDGGCTVLAVLPLIRAGAIA